MKIAQTFDSKVCQSKKKKCCGSCDDETSEVYWKLMSHQKLLMVVGVDVHHDTSKRNRSVMGFVASVNR